jgi:mannosyltransferase OCH1-like enzyme
MDSVRDFCKEFGYQYKLWDDETVSTLNMVNRLYYQNEQSYHGKSDILRYEILYQFGGVYIDADSYIVKPDKLHTILKKFNEDAGFGYERDGELICGGVSIAQKHSKFMKACIDAIPNRDMRHAPWISVGPMLITDLFRSLHQTIPIRLYPSKTFYPISWHGIHTIDAHKHIDIPEESVMFQYGYSTNNLGSQIH